MKILRLVVLGLGGLLGLSLLGSLITLWVYRDLPAEALEEQYAKPPSRFVEAGGVRYHVRQEGTGPDVVLLHASFGNLFMWDDLVDSLKGKYRFTRLDSLAHGLTGPGPSKSYTTDDLSILLHALMEELDLTDFHLVGTSSGGIVAFTYAADYADNIKSLILINSAGLIHKTVNPNASQTIPVRSFLLSHVTPKPWVDRFIKGLIRVEDRATPDVLQTYYDMLMRDGNRQAILRGFKYYTPRNPNPWLNRIEDPTLIIWSDGSVLPETEALEFAANLTQTSVAVEIIKGGGHALPISSPEEIATLSDTFWQTVENNAD